MERKLTDRTNGTIKAVATNRTSETVNRSNERRGGNLYIYIARKAMVFVNVRIRHNRTKEKR